MKRFFTIALILVTTGVFAQSYNNEWIDYSKTYYKFKIAANGVCRIPQPTRAAAGLGSIPAQSFQLFRNGQEVPIYTTVPNGALGPSDYIEFWGRMNDGAPDNPLYRVSSSQHTQHWSLETDTAVYFLTVNPAGTPFHYQQTTNDTTGTPLTVEPYFMHKAGTYFHSQINPGFAQDLGEYVYSSSYDIGEYWSSAFITPAGPLSDNQSNLFVYSGGPSATLQFGMSGCANNVRSVQVSLNNTIVVDTEMDSFYDLLNSKSIALSLLTSGSAALQFATTCGNSTDRAVASFYELTYPRQFNFGGQPNFFFELPARSSGYFLKISNFGTSGSNVPVLYDMTNGWRYSAIVGSDGTLSFLLGGSAAARKLVLVNEDPSLVQTVTSLAAPRTFINFANSANQGNYIIISSPLLYTGSSGNNPVQDYRSYRNSIAGGNFNAHVYEIDELTDQFAFGIKKHPLAIQNFLRYARANFGSNKPQYVLLMGHGMVYSDYYNYSEKSHDPLADKLDIIPTFGFPASDNKLSVDNGAGDVPITPIGRLSVVAGTEIETYLTKVKAYESLQATAPNTADGRLWMKNVLHVTGASEVFLGSVLCSHMLAYQQIISDTLYGANVTLLCDGNASQVSQIPGDQISALFSQGLSMLTYFGHSANTSLGYNLDDPTDYYNPGKYPVFYVNGCDAGDFYVYDAQRFNTSKTLSELYVLAKDRGAIAFVASSHFGVVNYLDLLLSSMYNLIKGADYGKPIGIIEKDAFQAMLNVVPGDYFGRLHAEEMNIHGDPYLRLNQEALPDYDIEQSMLQVSPSFISVSSQPFAVNVKWVNLGRAVRDSITIVVTRTYPDGTSVTLLRKRVRGTDFADSLQMYVPIQQIRDKGNNKITVTINSDNDVTEVTRANNTVSTSFVIYENEATPVYPYDYAIINTPTSKLIASTANPLSPVQQYVMEIDTTQLFNSGLKVDKFLTQVGGELEFDPGITYMDSVVYYWRVSPVPANGGTYLWDNASFIYIDPAHSSTGSAQGHYFQHLSSSGDSITLAAGRKWVFGSTSHSVYQRNAVYPDGGTFDNDFSVTIDGNEYIQSACVGQSLIFNVFDPVTMHAWKNVDALGNNLHIGGSGSANCSPSRNWNFEWSYMSAANRDLMRRFMDSIPNGTYVTIKNIPFDYQGGNVYASTWKGDTTLYGVGNTLYDHLVSAGFAAIDSFSEPRSFVFIYKKGDPTYPPQWKMSQGIFDPVALASDCPTPVYLGWVVSPRFGPAKQWKQVHWRGTSLSTPVTDTAAVQVIGIDTLGIPAVLYTLNKANQDFDISSVNAVQYPYIQLKMITSDSVHAIPYQLQYWRLNYLPVPEGALAPNLLLKSKDTLALGEQLEFAIAFKNVSMYNFDSMRIKMYILDRNNVMHLDTLPRKKPLISGDTVILDYFIDTKNFPGANTIYVDFNPNNDQPEQYTFNNFMYKNFFVRYDATNPLLDVTFDNVHILNNDIVSAKPHIEIKLKSKSPYVLLQDTSEISVQVRFPDGSLHSYNFNSDTMRFIPATSGSDNTATVEFNPSFLKQINPAGDVYELIINGKDGSGNPAGTIPYRVDFKVITKPMISNMLNYPNPFTTSTAFVFTITGTDVPQNIKIQILTITGKIVREITKDELGPLHIGTNVTEFKWNGTDMYGQRLANGVYLYHVITNLNGKSLDKYSASGDNTDQFFNNGYGKMYLMK
ncbi:MAG: C25 family cysteine peptidase [Bacteroidota bacterium]|nr:C25 family cysteine peptidase [Bacteroidota bacterium]